MSTRSVSLGLVVVFALAACGGGTAPSVLVSQGPANPGAGASTVAIIDNAFQPADLTVKVGTTVTWTNKGQRGHTVSTSDGGFGSDGTLKSGATYSRAFDTAGTFAYFCAIHSSMKATITVTP
ncbi:MAG: plastocyanin/azurin family copper-binding protein [Chloroflexota bacterium]